VLVRAAKADSAQKSKYTPTSARDAVETALRLQKETGNMTEAIRLYALAMEMKPNQDEARAALYNMGCALAKQKQWSEATKCVVKSINDYGLKLTVALNVSKQMQTHSQSTQQRSFPDASL
jgi:tetratricopeptide (TPR) repeat protein